MRDDRGIPGLPSPAPWVLVLIRVLVRLMNGRIAELVPLCATLAGVGIHVPLRVVVVVSLVVGCATDVWLNIGSVLADVAIDHRLREGGQGGEQ